jgi:predicted RNA-binding Zn ribbon-like protein
MVIIGEKIVIPSEASPWSFQAGNLALNFANTVDWHASQNPDELLTSYTALVNWSVDFGVLQEADANPLHVKAREYPDEAADALAQAILIREAIYRIFHAVAQREAPPGEDLETLKEAQARAISSARLVPQEKGFGWDWPFEPPSFEQMLWPTWIYCCLRIYRRWGNVRTNVAAAPCLSIPAATIAVSGAVWILAAIGQRRNDTTLDIKEQEGAQSDNHHRWGLP